MEFYCVLSIGGSLASYQVRREEEGKYNALLWNNNGRRDDLPAEISLYKEAGNWQARPWHEEIVAGLVQAIEANGKP